MNMLSMMYVVVGGAFGSLCRYLLANLITRYNTAPFPYGTFTVNITGSFLLGVWIAIMAFTMPAKARDLHLLLAVGALGGFTTFSAFSLDAFLLIERGLIAEAVVYIGGTVLLSILALGIGMWLTKLAVAG